MQRTQVQWAFGPLSPRKQIVDSCRLPRSGKGFRPGQRDQLSALAWLQQLRWVNRQLGTISISVFDPGVRQPTNLEETYVPEADQFDAEGTQAMPSTPFVSRMGSSIFESLRFRTSIVPPWGQVT